MDGQDSAPAADILPWLLRELSPMRKTTSVDLGAPPIHAPDYADLRKIDIQGAGILGVQGAGRLRQRGLTVMAELRLMPAYHAEPMPEAVRADGKCGRDAA